MSWRDNIQLYEKTKQAMAFLAAIHADDDINRVNDSKAVRPGRGKMRNRRYIHRRGPMLVMPDNRGVRAFRNIFGLDIANVNALNLLHLAPGGHVGRFLVWTKGAFEALDKIFGTFTSASEVKKGFFLPIPQITSTDITRIMHSDEVRRALKPKKLPARKLPGQSRRAPTNGMKNRHLRVRLNPYSRMASANARSLRVKKVVQMRRKNKDARIAKAKKGVKKMVLEGKKGRKGAKKVAAKK